MIGRFAVIAVAVLAFPTLALGADRARMRDAPKHPVPSEKVEPYPLSWRAAKIRRADGCWHACLANTGRSFQACLRAHRPTLCVGWNADANHHCLRACRLAGGPWIDVFEWRAPNRSASGQVGSSPPIPTAQ
jgi:hypothetical protein